MVLWIEFRIFVAYTRKTIHYRQNNLWMVQCTAGDHKLYLWMVLPSVLFPGYHGLTTHWTDLYLRYSNFNSELHSKWFFCFHVRLGLTALTVTFQINDIFELSVGSISIYIVNFRTFSVYAFVCHSFHMANQCVHEKKTRVKRKCRNWSCSADCSSSSQNEVKKSTVLFLISLPDL